MSDRWEESAFEGRSDYELVRMVTANDGAVGAGAQGELTRRLMNELRRFSKTTTALTAVIIGLAVVQVVVAIIVAAG